MPLLLIKKLFAFPGGVLSTLFSKSDIPLASEVLTKQLTQQLTHARQELALLKGYQQEILESIPLGACLLDAEKKIRIWNKTITLLSGVPQKDAVGCSILELPELWKDLLMRMIENNNKQLRNLKIESSDRTKWLNLHKATFQNSGLSSTVLLIEDITEQYLLEVELAHSERLAAIGRLAAGVAHEIGNPITAIACLAQNLGAEQANREVQSVTEQVLEQTQRVANILQSLVHFSQNTKQDPLIQEPVNVYEVVEEAIHLTRLSPKGKLLHYQNACDRNLIIIGDSQRLLQVFIHLLDNAKDASDPQQGIFLSTETHSRHLEITIRDEGHGIPANQLNRVFDPFFTTKAPGQGCGLGLPLAYSILKEQGGHIYIDSAPGKGTQVIIRLPHPKKPL